MTSHPQDSFCCKPELHATIANVRKIPYIPFYISI